MNPVNFIPVNRIASIVGFSKGEHYNFKGNEYSRDKDIPYQIRPIRHSEYSNPSFIDITGRKYGRLTVLGLSADVPKRWVVRCDCGKYSMRQTKSLRLLNQMMCDECTKVERMRGML